MGRPRIRLPDAGESTHAWKTSGSRRRRLPHEERTAARGAPGPEGRTRNAVEHQVVTCQPGRNLAACAPGARRQPRHPRCAGACGLPAPNRRTPARRVNATGGARPFVSNPSGTPFRAGRAALLQRPAGRGRSRPWSRRTPGRRGPGPGRGTGPAPGGHRARCWPSAARSAAFPTAPGAARGRGRRAPAACRPGARRWPGGGRDPPSPPGAARPSRCPRRAHPAPGRREPAR